MKESSGPYQEQGGVLEYSLRALSNRCQLSHQYHVSFHEPSPLDFHFEESQSGIWMVLHVLGYWLC